MDAQPLARPRSKVSEPWKSFSSKSQAKYGVPDPLRPDTPPSTHVFPKPTYAYTPPVTYTHIPGCAHRGKTPFSRALSCTRSKKTMPER